MVDIYKDIKRKEIMSKIRSKNTKPEVIVRTFLFNYGFRYIKNDKRYPGKPDIVLPKYKTIIFINGCFWHGHDRCKAASLPKTREEFWRDKIEANKKRDKEIIDDLLQEGWKVIVVWECEINSKKKQQVRLPKLVEEIKE